MRGGAKPGERRGGRKTGTPNKATAEAKIALEELARGHAKTALKALVDVAMKGSTEAARVSAAVAILDRGYGKPRQSVDMNANVKTAVQSLSDDELDARIAAFNAKT